MRKDIPLPPSLGSASDTPSTIRVLPTGHHGSNCFGARVWRNRKRFTGLSLLKIPKNGKQGTMWSGGRKRLLVRGREKGMFLASVGPVRTEVVFCDLCVCVYDFVCVCFCTGDFMCTYVRQ